MKQQHLGNLDLVTQATVLYTLGNNFQKRHLLLDNLAVLEDHKLKAAISARSVFVHHDTTKGFSLLHLLL